MKRLGDQLTMCHTITSRLIGHDFPGFTAMTPQQALEESFSRCTITPVEITASKVVDISKYRWEKHCRGLFELPTAA